MKDFKMEYPPGATPLNPDEVAGLKLTYISTQRELNAAEQDNILQGQTWAFSKKRKNVLTEKFARELHGKMFGHVWKWAGTYRTSDKSIGVPWFKIPEEMLKTLADASYWVTYESYPLDEIGARFHHRLVWIHPFPNGNGRWARVATDLLMIGLGGERFTWGAAKHAASLDEHGETRKAYLHALKMADAKKFGELIAFIRS